MIGMSTILAIKQRAARGDSVAQIAREEGISEPTVRKYRDMDGFSPPVKPRKRRGSKLDPFKATIDRWLAEDRKRRPKQRHTAQRVFDRLVAECGYDGSYTIVQAYVKKRKAELKGAKDEFLNLEWAPGEGQVDFGVCDFRVLGVMREVHYLVVTFPFSNVSLAQCFWGETSECVCEGLKAVFTDLAADAVVSGGQTMNPATEDILAAIQSVPAKTVFVLPNNKNIIMAAEQAQKLADRQVVVLPTRTVPMGITALLNIDPSVNAETNTINMMAAADKVSTGLITYAARDSEYDGKRIRKGEIMALENGKIVSTSTDITKATYRLARGMCKKDSSFVTIISGCDVSDEDAEKVTEIVKAKCPNHVEVSHIRGGQPVYYYMISVE